MSLQTNKVHVHRMPNDSHSSTHMYMYSTHGLDCLDLQWTLEIGKRVS